MVVVMMIMIMMMIEEKEGRMKQPTADWLFTRSIHMRVGKKRKRTMWTRGLPSLSPRAIHHIIEITMTQ